MSFEKGAMKFRAYHLGAPVHAEKLLAGLRARALPADRPDPGSVYDGFVSPVHALDSDISMEKLFGAGVVARGSHVSVQRKIPKKLFESRVAVTAGEHLAKYGELTRRDVAEIKKDVALAMLPAMPEFITDVPFAVTEDMVFAAAGSDRAADSFAATWTWAMGRAMIPVNFYTLVDRAGAKVADLSPVMWPPAVYGSATYNNPPADFLTWLWLSGLDAPVEILGKKRRLVISVAPGDVVVDGEESDDRITLKGGSDIKKPCVLSAITAGRKAVKLPLFISIEDAAHELKLDERMVVSAFDQGADGEMPERMAAARRVVGALAAAVGVYCTRRKDVKAWALDMGAARENMKKARGDG